jgi:hypothetical protein
MYKQIFSPNPINLHTPKTLSYNCAWEKKKFVVSFFGFHCYATCFYLFTFDNLSVLVYLLSELDMVMFISETFPWNTL